MQARNALGLHIHAENPREGDGGIGADEARFDGVQNAPVVEAGSRRSERMRLKLDNTRFDIVVRPAGLLMRYFRRVVAVQVM